MTHPPEGALQALLEGELASNERSVVERHVAGCDRCGAELRELTSAAELIARAVARLDVAPPTERARWEIERRRRSRPRLSMVALRRAAVLLLGSAAVLSATVPGSPLRDWLTGTWGVPPTAENAHEAETTLAVAAAPRAAAAAGVSVLPETGRMRVVLSTPAPGLRVQVQLHGGERVGVWAEGEAAQARFTTAPERIEALGAGAGVIRVEIPRRVAHATLEVGGEVYLVKDGDQLRFPGPAVDTAGPEILFQVGS